MKSHVVVYMARHFLFASDLTGAREGVVGANGVLTHDQQVWVHSVSRVFGGFGDQRICRKGKGADASNEAGGMGYKNTSPIDLCIDAQGQEAC